MSLAHALPEGARCAGHPSDEASWLCHRCGSFMCPACERRTRPDARPLCPACWDLRDRVVQRNTVSRTRLQTTGLVLGVVSAIPLWPLLVASLVVNIVAIVKAREPPARDVRWRPITGLALTCVWIVLWIGMVFVFV